VGRAAEQTVSPHAISKNPSPGAVPRIPLPIDLIHMTIIQQEGRTSSLDGDQWRGALKIVPNIPAQVFGGQISRLRAWASGIKTPIPYYRMAAPDLAVGASGSNEASSLGRPSFPRKFHF